MTPIHDALIAELGEPDLTPAPDFEVSVAVAVLSMAAEK